MRDPSSFRFVVSDRTLNPRWKCFVTLGMGCIWLYGFRRRLCVMYSRKQYAAGVNQNRRLLGTAGSWVINPFEWK